PAPQEVRFDVSLPRALSADFTQLAISPDGKQLVAAPKFGPSVPLWLRPIASTSGTTLPGTEGAAFPFWSPDGASIGFFADDRLKRVDMKSGTIQVLADAKDGRGASWSAWGIIFSAASGAASRAIFSLP